MALQPRQLLPSDSLNTQFDLIAYLQTQLATRASYAEMNSAISAALSTYATSAQVTADIAAAVATLNQAINALTNGAPELLNTLNELAQALGSDPSFATTVTNQLALKAPITNANLLGAPTAPTPPPGDASTRIATMAALSAALGGLGSGSTVPSHNSDTRWSISGLTNGQVIFNRDSMQLEVYQDGIWWSGDGDLDECVTLPTGGGGFNALVYGQGLYLAHAYEALTGAATTPTQNAISVDGKRFAHHIAQASNPRSSTRAIDFANGQWYGHEGATHYRGSDPFTWSTHTPGLAANMTAAVFAAGRFCLLCSTNNTTTFARSSTTGTGSWSNASVTDGAGIGTYGAQSPAHRGGVAVGNDIIVAHVSGGTVARSANGGQTWTTHSVSAGISILFGVFWDGSKFIAVGRANNTKVRLSTSTDGITWTAYVEGGPQHNKECLNIVSAALAPSGHLYVLFVSASTDGHFVGCCHVDTPGTWWFPRLTMPQAPDSLVIANKRLAIVGKAGTVPKIFMSA